MKSRSVAYLLLAVGSMLCAASATAAVKPAALFSDGAVLQQGMKVPVWGTANEGEKVTVSLQGQTVTATAKDGRWRAELAPLTAGGRFEMTIAGENTIRSITSWLAKCGSPAANPTCNGR